MRDKPNKTYFLVYLSIPIVLVIGLFIGKYIKREPSSSLEQVQINEYKRNGVKVFLSLPKNRFLKGEKVKLQVDVTNTNLKSVEVSTRFLSGQSIRLLTTRQGKNIRPIYAPPKMKRASVDALYSFLEPGDSFSREIDLFRYYGPMKTGQYEIILELTMTRFNGRQIEYVVLGRSNQIDFIINE